MPDRHKFDILQYHRKDIDWLALNTIVFLVNVVLIVLESFVNFSKLTPNEFNEPALRPLMI
jgi:hypothetical protein